MSLPFIPKRIVVTAYPKMPEAFTEAEAMSVFLKERGMDAPVGSLYDEDLRRRVKQGEFDMLIAVGGDGSVLRAGHLCAPSKVPILGVNLGRLGFLIQIDRKEWHEYFDRLFKGEAWIENRMMLHAEHFRAGEKIGTSIALNEVVVGRGQNLRPVRLTAYVDSRELTSYVADGLIAATATGSTAYALAAGGPILPPELRNILLVPIAPHLSVDRAVVLSEGVTVGIKIKSENAILSVDGQPPTPLMEDDHVNVTAADVTAQFVRFGNPGYFYRNITMHINENSSGFPR
ncbi:MAG: NAD(+)/NADH kinase [Anaerolineales bacterium]|jgi:NAD+ kinase|uniref:NAD(+)/NADH kinase n=1 Tax=Candidatus Villigracilis vicinus TaxID=3140679 RepID=UPI0031369EFD|nr:NAD(+)/NADH kinase [Anaerolineales bacterium]MBK7450033.1 NAD(+)/NADH kinase [Anaerolineales bacterium]MBK9779732.1 NAD(+)/NADH kinase [Anaerolineales bacterium]